MSETLLVALILCSGAVAGVMAGLLGVGGGIIIVPALFFLFTFHHVDAGTAMPLAIGTSLASIVLTSMVSAAAHHRRGNVDWHRVRLWTPLVVGGAVAGAWLAALLGGHTLKLVFGFFLVYMSLHLWKGAQRQTRPPGPWPGLVLSTMIPTVVGCLSAILGVGGGLMLVPILQHFHYSLHRAVATSAAFGAVVGIPATLTYMAAGWQVDSLPDYSGGYVNGLALLLIASATTIFTPLGVRLSYRLKIPTIKRIFALFTLIMGIRMVMF